MRSLSAKSLTDFITLILPPWGLPKPKKKYLIFGQFGLNRLVRGPKFYGHSELGFAEHRKDDKTSTNPNPTLPWVNAQNLLLIYQAADSAERWFCIKQLAAGMISAWGQACIWSTGKTSGDSRPRKPRFRDVVWPSNQNFRRLIFVC